MGRLKQYNNKPILKINEDFSFKIGDNTLKVKEIIEIKGENVVTITDENDEIVSSVLLSDFNILLERFRLKVLKKDLIDPIKEFKKFNFIK
jgi:hypothetical protein